jgi:hypothetical protein
MSASPHRSNFSPSNAKKIVPARLKISSLSQHKHRNRQMKAGAANVFPPLSKKELHRMRFRVL